MGNDKVNNESLLSTTVCDNLPMEFEMENIVKSYLLPYPYAPIQPIVRSLKRQELYNYVFTIDQFLLPEECEMWIEYAESIGFEEVFQKESSEYAHRDNGRIQYNDEHIAKDIFNRLAVFLPSSLDGLYPHCCSSNIRLYRYNQGQRFGRHIDESHSGEEGCSKFTLLIYLNGDLDISGEQDKESDKMGALNLRGGETMFYSHSHSRDPVACVRPLTGKMLLHGHGRMCLTHEGAEVLSGVKYLLRTDVMYK